MDRLDKTVAKQMNLSRSGARQLIRSGAVEVNGKKIFAADEQIDINSDELKISGKIVTVRRYLYIMLNKPSGVLSAAKDPDCPTASIFCRQSSAGADSFLPAGSTKTQRDF